MHEIKLNCTFFDPLRWLRSRGTKSCREICSIDNYFSWISAFHEDFFKISTKVSKKFNERSQHEAFFSNLFNLKSLFQVPLSSFYYSSPSATNSSTNAAIFTLNFPPIQSIFYPDSQWTEWSANNLWFFNVSEVSRNVKHQKEWIFSLTFMDHLLTLLSHLNYYLHLTLDITTLHQSLFVKPLHIYHHYLLASRVSS